MATAMPTRGNHGSAVAAAAEESGSAPVTRSGAALAVARRATDMQSRRAGTDVPTMSGLATLHLFVFDSMGNTRHKVAVGSGGATVIATYEYDPYGRLLYADPPPAQETAPQFLFSTKLYESHWQQYYYGYRYYSLDFGRWLSRDPIYDGHSEGLYIFVRNCANQYYDLRGLLTLGSFTIFFSDHVVLADSGTPQKHRKLADGAHRIFYYACEIDAYNLTLLSSYPDENATLSYHRGHYKRIDYSIGFMGVMAPNLHGVCPWRMNDGRGPGVEQTLADLQDVYKRAENTIKEEMCTSRTLCLDKVKLKVVLDERMLTKPWSACLYEKMKGKTPRSQWFNCEEYR